MRVEWTDRLAATSKKEWTTIEQGKERMGVHRLLLYLWLHQYVKRLKVWNFRQSNDTETAVPVPLYGNEPIKTGLHILDEYVG